MRNINRIGRLLAILALVLGFAVSAHAQKVFDAPASVSLSLTVGESVTISASPASISFTYDGINAATASGPITVTTTANLLPGAHSNIKVGSWLGSATASLAGPSNIPSSEVYANVNGTGPSPCTYAAAPTGGFTGGNGPFWCVGNGLSWIDNSSTGVQAGGIITLTDSVVLSLSGLGVLQAGSYTGTINFESVAV